MWPVPGVLNSLTSICAPKKSRQAQNSRSTRSTQDVPKEEPAGSESQEYTCSITRGAHGGTSRIGIPGIHLFNYKMCPRRYQQDRNPRSTLVQLQEVPKEVPAGSKSQEYTCSITRGAHISTSRHRIPGVLVQIQDMPKEILAGLESQEYSIRRCAQRGYGRITIPEA